MEAVAARSKSYEVKEVRFRVLREPGEPDPRYCSGPEEVAALIAETGMIPDDAREHFIVLLLNSQNRVLRWHQMAHGTLTATLVSPREIFGTVFRLELGVASIILVHNHPSGDPTPSREDVRLTRELATLGKQLEVPVRDHLIIGNGTGKWISMERVGMLP